MVMIQRVHTGLSPPIERGLELTLSIPAEKVANSISDATTTFTSVPGVATSLMARCWSAFRDGVLAIWKSVVGMSTWVWNCMILVLNKRTTVEKLKDLRASVEEFNRCKTHGNKELDAAISVMRAAYDELPDRLKKEMSKTVQALAEVSNENASDILCVSLLQGINLESVIDDLYERLPSVKLGHLEVELSRATDDYNQLECLAKILGIKISDLEPELTEDVLDKHMLVSFDRLNNALKETIYTEIRKQTLISLPEAPHGSQPYSSITIDGREIDLKPLDSGSVIFRHLPRGFAVRGGLLMLHLRSD